MPDVLFASQRLRMASGRKRVHMEQHYNTGTGRAAVQATLLHVVCGECQGVPDTERERHRRLARDAIRNGLRVGLKTATNKGRRGTFTNKGRNHARARPMYPLGDDRTEMWCSLQMISAAQRRNAH